MSDAGARAVGDTGREGWAMPARSPGGASPGPAQRVQCPPSAPRPPPPHLRSASASRRPPGVVLAGPGLRTRGGLTPFWCPAPPAVRLFLHSGKLVHHLCPTRLCIPKQKGLIGLLERSRGWKGGRRAAELFLAVERPLGGLLQPKLKDGAKSKGGQPEAGLRGKLSKSPADQWWHEAIFGPFPSCMSQAELRRNRKFSDVPVLYAFRILGYPCCCSFVLTQYSTSLLS
ncbi:uncharacterized protein LOC143692205 [Agelaius phoeniceus]|uniref:uncharacterized protein LOC143692205 n=1 Tax=Agelaius phoeniceus TaxID=39638 RepID=UPI004054C6D9